MPASRLTIRKTQTLNNSQRVIFAWRSGHELKIFMASAGILSNLWSGSEVFCRFVPIWGESLARLSSSTGLYRPIIRPGLETPGLMKALVASDLKKLAPAGLPL